MKVLYSQIKNLVPDIDVSPHKIGNILTMIGFMMDGIKEVKYQSSKDFLISLEVRQNRNDCLSVIGLAREIAAYCRIAIKLPDIPRLEFKNGGIDIGVEAKDCIKRILAVKITGLENKESPNHLKEFLSFYEINSVNLLVDLSNYVMLLTGYPSHLIDFGKINGRISWSLNGDFSRIVTLDGSTIELKKKELIIRDSKNILALAGIVGGEKAKIDLSTETIIAEMAVYKHSVVRKDSRALKVATESSHRLEKRLDPNGSEYAIKMLISLILENCGGHIDSEVFEYYPKKQVSPNIEFYVESPTVYSGIDISKEETLEIFKSLDFKISDLGNKLIVTPPTYRMDISMEEDLIEEVIRMTGYWKIPSDEVPKLQIVKDITPRNIYLSEKIRDILTVLGFDEILSLPLTRKGDNEKTNYLEWEVVSTQNSVNEVYPDLRQTTAVGLLNQLDEYLKKNLEHIKIFEIGKVFGRQSGMYKERENLGILMQSSSNISGISGMKKTVERLLRLVGFVDIVYKDARFSPHAANPYSCWNIFVNKENAGILYKLNNQRRGQSAYFAEIDIDKITKLLESTDNNPALELGQKLIVLDANVEMKQNEEIDEYLDEVKKKIKPENLWSIAITDKFKLNAPDKKVRYTVRVSYYGLSDQDAKKLHLKVFNI